MAWKSRSNFSAWSAFCHSARASWASGSGSKPKKNNGKPANSLKTLLKRDWPCHSQKADLFDFHPILSSKSSSINFPNCELFRCPTSPALCIRKATSAAQTHEATPLERSKALPVPSLLSTSTYLPPTIPQRGFKWNVPNVPNIPNLPNVPGSLFVGGVHAKHAHGFGQERSRQTFCFLQFFVGR